ncbi:MAG: hypothetical protein Fur0010_05630 [Bdellovibrio sp.]
MSGPTFSQVSNSRRECVQRVAEFYGVELGEKKVIEGTNVGGRKCQVAITLERNVSEFTGDETHQIVLQLDSESEFKDGRLAKNVWATLSEDTELARTSVDSCSIQDGKLVLDFSVKNLSGYRQNARFQIAASSDSIAMKEKVWGLFTSGSKSAGTCQF